jgi:hypothetical protein
LKSCFFSFSIILFKSSKWAFQFNLFFKILHFNFQQQIELYKKKNIKKSFLKLYLKNKKLVFEGEEVTLVSLKEDLIE